MIEYICTKDERDIAMQIILPHFFITSHILKHFFLVIALKKLIYNLKLVVSINLLKNCVFLY